MIIVQDTDSAQEVKFIPRELYSGVGVATFTDKTTKEVFTYSVDLLIDRYYVYFSEAMTDLLEDHSYEVIITDGTNEIYRALAFCTNQSGYSINNGQFTERTTTNDYIILE